MIINSQNRKLSNATSTQTKSHVESPLSNLEGIDRPVNFLSFSSLLGSKIITARDTSILQKKRMFLPGI